MVKDKKQQKQIQIIFIYSVLFLCICVVSFAWFFIRRKTFIWVDSDGYLQHIPWLKKLHDLIRAGVSGKGFEFWSFDIGLGADQIGNLYSVLFDPFNYVAAAFPVKYLSIGYTFACILRLYTAGLCMMTFLRYHLMPDSQQIIGAISYAFCYWMIGSFQQSSFLNVAILFPLIILGIDKILDKKRPYLFIAAVTIALMESAYFTYMSAVLSIIYYVVRYWLGAVTLQVSLKNYLLKTFEIFLYVCISCFLASMALIPAVYTLLNSMMSSGVESSLLPSVKSLLFWILSLSTPNSIFGHYSFTGTNALLLATVPLMTDELKHRDKRVPVIMFFFCFIAVEIPAWDILMNGFSYPVGRWCYALAFFFVWAGVQEIDRLIVLAEDNNRKFILWMFFLAIPVFVLCNINHTLSPYRCLISIINIGFMAVFVFRHSSKKEIQYVLLTANIGICLFFYYSPHGANKLKEYESFNTSYSSYNNSVLKVGKDIHDSGFYRMDFSEHVTKNGKKQTDIDMPSNEALYWGENTLTAYISTLNYKLGEFNKAIANNGAGKRRTSFISFDNRARLNYLLGVKYFLYDALTEEQSAVRTAGYNYSDFEVIDGVSIMKSKIEPSLGYVFNQAISESDFKRYSALGKEQILMQRAVIDKNQPDIITPISSNDIRINGIQFDVAEDSEIKITNNSFVVNESSRVLKLRISHSDIRGSEVFLSFKGLKNGARGNVVYSVSGENAPKLVCYKPSNAQAIENVEEFLTNIGYYDTLNGDGILTIDFHENGAYTFDALDVFSVPIDTFEKQAEGLSASRLIITEKKNDYIKGRVKTPNDGILFLSLVYNPGWAVYIDGERQDTFITDLCFTGVKVSAGQHEVVLRYRPVGFHISIIMFFTGIMCIIGIELYYRKKEKSKSKECNAA